jgi:hypothetical protein
MADYCDRKIVQMLGAKKDPRVTFSTRFMCTPSKWHMHERPISILAAQHSVITVQWVKSSAKSPKKFLKSLKKVLNSLIKS